MNKRFTVVLLVCLALTVSCHNKIVTGIQVKVEKDSGFELLFDGTSTNGWRGYQKHHVP